MTYLQTPSGMMETGQAGLTPVTNPRTLQGLNAGNTTTAGGAGVADVTSPPPAGQNDPYTRFNVALMGLLDKAKGTGDPEALYKSREQLNSQALNLSNPLNATPYQSLFQGMSPQASLAAQQGTQAAFHPGLTSITDQINANNDAQSQFTNLANAGINAGQLMYEQNKPVEVGIGSTLVNPRTGEVISQGMNYNDKQSRDTFFNLAQTYPDAGAVWSDVLTPAQNLAAAQLAVSRSPSFEAKQTVYAINPLTGQPTIINKRQGAGTVGGTNVGGTPSDGVTLADLAPELRGALTTIGDIQFFNASNVTSGQLPYLQRASQALNIPLLDKGDADKVQEAYQSYSSATALLDQIKRLTKNVITAHADSFAQSVQATNLARIEFAPALSANEDAKQFISARNSVLSLLTRAAGEKGTLTNQDVARIANALPGYGDSAVLAAEKTANMNEVLASVFSGSVKTYIGSKTGGTPASTPPATDATSMVTMTGPKGTFQVKPDKVTLFQQNGYTITK